MRNRIAAIVLVISGSISAGCWWGAGPCVHVFRDELVHVRAVVDSATGAGIDSVVITNVRVRGTSLPLSLVVLPAPGQGEGVSLDGDTLRCSVPCAFGTQDGRWELTLLARGYPPQTLAFDASYGEFRGGCPSYNDHGTWVVLHLVRPQGP